MNENPQELNTTDTTLELETKKIDLSAVDEVVHLASLTLPNGDIVVGEFGVTTNAGNNIPLMAYTEEMAKKVTEKSREIIENTRSILKNREFEDFDDMDEDDDRMYHAEDDMVQEEDVVQTINFPYVDREISWLKFNRRVLDLAATENNPLLERVKFLSITSSNLDEFFAIRVASRIKEDENTEFNLVGTNKSIVNRIVRDCAEMHKDMDDVYFTLIDKLKEKDIAILDNFDKNKVKKYFRYDVKPSLAPLALDATRPLPQLKPFSIYIALFVQAPDGNERFGLIEVPAHLDRVVNVGKRPSKSKKSQWLFIEDIIIANIHDLYPGAKCENVTAFRVIRDGDTVIAQDEKSYVKSMALHARNRLLHNTPVRLDVWENADDRIIEKIQSELDIKGKSIFRIRSRLKLSDIIQLYKASDDPEMKYPPFKPADPILSDRPIMKELNHRDIMVHHPYESFSDSVLRFIREACEDPHVISIKQTLYRSGEDSKIARYLIRAAQSGKNVTVVMELKARFDEETNIEWAEKLKQAGAVVVYGYEHLKTHAKMVHVFRKDAKGAAQYCHIGTGNYSEKNSKIYTDFSYFTSNKKTCSDINNVFNMLTGGMISDQIKFHSLYIAPLEIRPMLNSLIDEEMTKGSDGYISMKVNNLSDVDFVKRLYDASQAGVKIDIICRGSCSLIPGIPGISDTITVNSIVGRFLEHSRVFVFGKQGSNGIPPRVFITSADMMTRNLDRRIELLLEIENPSIRKMLINYMDMMHQDKVNSYSMMPDFNHETSIFDDAYYIKNSGEFDAQDALISAYR